MVGHVTCVNATGLRPFYVDEPDTPRPASNRRNHMHKLAPTVLAALLGLAAFSATAETIQLNDGERSELRAKADGFRQEGRNDRTMTTDVRGSTHGTATKTSNKTKK